MYLRISRMAASCRVGASAGLSREGTQETGVAPCGKGRCSSKSAVHLLQEQKAVWSELALGGGSLWEGSPELQPL